MSRVWRRTGIPRVYRGVYIHGWCIPPYTQGGIYTKYLPYPYPGWHIHQVPPIPTVYNGPYLPYPRVYNGPYLLTHGYNRVHTSLTHGYNRVHTSHTHGFIPRVYLSHLRVYTSGCTNLPYTSGCVPPIYLRVCNLHILQGV